MDGFLAGMNMPGTLQTSRISSEVISSLFGVSSFVTGLPLNISWIASGITFSISAYFSINFFIESF